MTIGIFVAGCSLRIPGPVFVDGFGPHFETVNATKSADNKTDPFASELKLVPGDVIYLTTINGGRRKGENSFLPTFNTVRVPLRFASGTNVLTDSELYFLFSTLSAARHLDIQNVFMENRVKCRELLGKVLNDHATEIWNKLMESLFVKRRASSGLGGTPALEVRIKRETIEPTLSVILKTIENGSDGTECKKPPTNGGDDSIRFLDDLTDIPLPYVGTESARSIASSLFEYNGASGNSSEGTTYLKPDDLARTAVSQVVFAGINANSLAWEESQWTLADWEGSGICSTDGKRVGEKSRIHDYIIKRIRLHTFPSSEYRIEPDEQAEVHVVHEFDQQQLLIERRLSRRSIWSTLSRSSLRSLTMADVSEIDWEDKNGNSVPIPNCKGR